MAWNDDLEINTPAYQLASSTSPTIRALAGPGSGKSFAIKRRVARLLESGVDPKKILAVTFTRTAAQDVKREISSLGIEGADEVHSRTLHSHALKILMVNEVLLSTRRVPRMVLDHEIQPALRDIDKAAYGDVNNKKKLTKEYLAAWASLQTDRPGFVKNPVQSDFESDLISWLTEHKGIQVGEVIPVVIEYLRNNPASPEIGKYEEILVDEYQDLNRSEQEFIKLLKGKSNVVIVGDDDQSIYGFLKFAHPEGIKDIKSLHGDFEDIEFSQCRRCPQQVTMMASKLISKNTNRTLGALIPRPENHYGIVEIVQWREYRDEIDGLVQVISKELKAGTLKPQDILILCPRRIIGYLLRDKLLALSIPVKSYFRESTIDNDKVRRAYSLVNFIANPNDSISLRYLLGFGSADFRKAQYNKLSELSSNKAIGVKEVLDEILNGSIPATNLSTIVQEYRKILTDVINLKTALTDSPSEGFQNFFIKNDDDELEFYELNQLFKNAVLDNPADDLKSSEEFDRWINSVFSCFQENIVMPELPEDVDHIRIMSLHASKGLSAKFVVLASMIDRLMPFVPQNAIAEEIPLLIEEQRRLFYVAMTRCKTDKDYPGRLIIRVC